MNKAPKALLAPITSSRTHREEVALDWVPSGLQYLIFSPRFPSEGQEAPWKVTAVGGVLLTGSQGSFRSGMPGSTQSTYGLCPQPHPRGLLSWGQLACQQTNHLVPAAWDPSPQPHGGPGPQTLRAHTGPEAVGNLNSRPRNYQLKSFEIFLYFVLGLLWDHRAPFTESSTSCCVPSFDGGPWRKS